MSTYNTTLFFTHEDMNPEFIGASSPKPAEKLKIKFIHSSHSKTSMGSCDTTFDESLLIFSKENFRSISPSFETFGDTSDMNSVNSGENTEDSSTILNSALNQKRKAVTDETKYKTELCKKWSDFGHCPYGKKCKFAHGRHELNEKKVLNKNRYKSRKCNSFHTTMNCSYGVRCLFAHEERPLKEISDANYYGKFIFCPELLQHPILSLSSRLPVFRYGTEINHSSLGSSVYDSRIRNDDRDYFLPFKTANCFMLGFDS